MSKSKNLLILDLDETLIFGSEQSIGRDADFVVGPFHIYLRPHVHPFLRNCTEWFELAVWTSSTSDYAAAVVAGVFPEPAKLQFVWARDRCTPRYDPEYQTHAWLKDLKKVKRSGYSLDRVLVVDDSPEKLSRNYGNHIRVMPFTGNACDDELIQLLPFLKDLQGVPDLRKVEKRGWKSR